MRKRIAILSLAFVLGSLGCGGGGGGGSVASAPTDLTMGNFTVRAAATNPPVTTTGQQTVATGVTGSFTLLRLRDQHVDLSDTRIAWTSNRTGSGDVFISNIDGSNTFRLTKTFDIQETVPAWNNGGNKIAFEGAQNVGGFDHDIFVYRYDGLFLQKVTNTPGTYESNPDWSPDGTKLIYDRSGGLVVFTFAGSVETPLATGGDAAHASWSSKNKLAWVSGRTGNNEIFTSNADGSSPVQQSFTAENDNSPTWSPDGDSLFWIHHGAVTNDIVEEDLWFFGGNTHTIYSTADAIDSIDVSPDGEFVMFEDITNDTLNRVSRNGGSASQMFEVPDFPHGASWGPFPSDRIFIGSGGLLAPSGAGFIYADASDRTQSVLAFDCTTRSSAILRAQTGQGGTQDSLVFALDADNVKLMKYANAPDWIATSVVEAGTAVPAANGALISIDSFDGKVNAVLPFLGSRAPGSAPTSVRQGSTIVFTGEFVGAFDKSGKNVAPSGGSRVTLDTKTGVLTAG